MAKYKLKGELEAEQYVHNGAVPYLQEWAGEHLQVEGKGSDVVLWVGLHRVALGEYLVKTQYGSMSVLPKVLFEELYEKVEDRGNLITSANVVKKNG